MEVSIPNHINIQDHWLCGSRETWTEVMHFKGNFWASPIKGGQFVVMVFLNDDNVSREKLWKVLYAYGVKGRLLRAIQAVYVNGRAKVKVGEMESELFEVHRGVRQGCTLSPWLFNVFIDSVTREARRQFLREVKLSTGDVGLLLFADDMVVMAESVEGL